jgi:hypothetical protein
MTGDVTIGFIPPEYIKGLQRDALNARRVTGIIIKDDKGQDIVLPVVASDKSGMAGISDEAYSTAANGTSGRLTGKCFYWAINRALTSARGSGDYVQSIRPAKDAVRVVKSISERTQINNSVIGEIIFKGTSWDQKAVNEAMRPGSETYINPPNLQMPGPKLFAHTENIEYNTKLPNIAASESTETFRMLKAMFCASTSYPEHWIFGQGENANRATAYEMGDPSYNYLNARQTSIKLTVGESIDFAIDQKRIFTHQLDSLTDEQLHAWEWVLPKVDVDDLEKRVSIGLQELNAITSARMGGDIDEEQAGSLTRDVLTKSLNMRVPEPTKQSRDEC